LTHTGCPVTTVSPEVPQHDYAIIYDDWHITAWQMVLSLSFSKEMSVTSSDIFDIWRCVWDGFLTASKSNTQLTEKPFHLGYWHVTFLTHIVTEDET
jgi:hypothetical protein